MKKSYLIAIFIAVAATLWVLSGVIMPSDGGASAPAATVAQIGGKAADEKRAEVRVRASAAAPVVNNIIVTGRSAPARNVILKAETSGQVTEIVEEEGAFVEGGQLIARLETRDREARVAEAGQRLQQREIEYNAAKSLQSKGLNSDVRLAQVQADMEQARAALKQAELELENTAITAPFDGVLYGQEIEIGDYVQEGDTLFGIVDLDPIAVRGFVTEQQVQEISRGGKAVAELLGNQAAEGIVTYIAPTANAETRTFEIEVSIPNPERRIVAGMTAQLRIPGTEKSVHKISPSVLALNDAGQVGVKYVDETETVRFAPVRIVADYADYMLVGGLPDQVNLITVGQDFVVPGQKVKPVLAEGDGLL